MTIKVPNCMAVTAQDRRWFVVRVIGGMADGVFAELGEAGYDVYLPAAATTRKTGVCASG